MEKKTVFLTAGLGKLNIHMQRMKVDAYLTPLTKINLKSIRLDSKTRNHKTTRK